MLDTPVLEVECHEPHKVITRRVYPLQFTGENIVTFWEKARRFRVLFSDEIAGSFQKFLEVFASQDEHGNIFGHGLAWVVDDFTGVFYMTDIKTTEATVHFSFFDGRFRGRLPLVRQMIKYAFERYNFIRLNVEIAKYADEKTFNFVEAIGFKEEGRKRKAVRFNGDLFDVIYYGLLREEAESWV